MHDATGLQVRSLYPGGRGGAEQVAAMVGCGEYPSVQAAAGAVVRVRESVLPDPAVAALYNGRYEVFRKLYPALKGVFPDLRAEK